MTQKAPLRGFLVAKAREQRYDSDMSKAVKTKEKIYPLVAPEERLLVLRKLRGMWKNRRPDPIKELAKMRREWDRKLLNLH